MGVGVGVLDIDEVLSECSKDLAKNLVMISLTKPQWKHNYSFFASITMSELTFFSTTVIEPSYWLEQI